MHRMKIGLIAAVALAGLTAIFHVSITATLKESIRQNVESRVARAQRIYRDISQLSGLKLANLAAERARSADVLAVFDKTDVAARQSAAYEISEKLNQQLKQDGRKARKRVLRKMKPLLRMIAEHARRHRDRLDSDYARTGYSRAQAEQIIARVNRTLAQVPAVITQAHERLIGDRTVPSEQKVLSIYEPDVKVIVRGKAGKEVEFGNTLFFAESAQGLILDWELYRQKAPPEWRQLQESIDRQNSFDLPTEIEAACGDRGFSAGAGRAAHGDRTAPRSRVSASVSGRGRDLRRDRGNCR